MRARHSDSLATDRIRGAHLARRSSSPAACWPQRVSLIGRELKISAGGGGRAIVPPRPEFDLAVHDPEIEAVDEPAIAALLAKISLAGSCPFSIGDDVVGDALAHDRCAP